MSATTAPVAPPSDLAPSVASTHAADFPVPTGREEQWRFTPLDRLAGLHADAPFDGEVKAAVEFPDGVVADLVAADDPRASGRWVPTERISARVLESGASVVLVEVAAGLEVAEPITVAVAGTGGTSAGRVLIRVGRDATAVVVLDHSGAGAHAATVEAIVGDGARLTLVSVQDWDATAVHAAHQHATVGRDATFTGINVTLGGDLVRVVSSVTYDGPGGDAELLGVYFADAGQHLEHRLFVDHEAPHCRSRVTYKGALQGEGAHTVWVGDVLIRADAKGTDTYELNRNLVLSDGARADSVPNLEIETGEIEGAGHASATGRFDDEQLFYLQSRGITEAAARRLVVIGFFAEVVERIPVPALRDRLLRSVESELGYVHDESGDVDA
ncbi:MAG: Fe-S cluster assembly protein SufD [Actinomycetota bacterium]|nr:Fe-S cluster assembly protein SufD [Actinomycetota bacterium]